MKFRLTALMRVIAFCLAGYCPAAYAHPPSMVSPDAEAATVEEVIAFRKLISGAITGKDAAALRKLYSDAFVHTHGSGKTDGKDARIVSALAGDPVIENASVTGIEVRVPGGWTAVATGVSPVKSLADGKTYAFRWTAVYVRNDDTWQLAASQATRLQEIK